jgi:hypothetical protein
MSIYYLIDANTPVIANSEINDVRYVAEDVVLGGNFCIALPDGVSIGSTDPTDLTDLLNKKYAGLLAAHPLYTDIAYESFVSAPNVDMANSTLAVGDRCTTKFLSDTGTYRSNATTLASTPTQAVVIFELSFAGGPNPIGDRATRFFELIPHSPTDGTCRVSFDNGATWLTVTTSGALLNIPVPSQGPDFIFRFDGISVKGTGLTSWAVIY